MTSYSSLAVLITVFLAAGWAAGQAPAKPAENVPRAAAEIRASAAYAELLLRQTEVQSELESLAVEYTEEYPAVAENRQILELINKEKARIAAVKPAEAAKLTLALGKLMVKKVEVELDLWKLRRSLQDAHPEVKRAKRKAEIYESAIREILG